MANSWVLSSWVDSLVLSSLFCHCRVRKFSQWFHFKGWVLSHMSRTQNYGKLFAGKMGMKYYPVIYGDIYHRPWIKDPGTWTNHYCMGIMSCQGFVLALTYLMQELVVHLFLVDGGSSLWFWIVGCLLTLTFGWSVVIPCCVELATCQMVNYQLEVSSWTRLNCNMSLWSLNPTCSFDTVDGRNPAPPGMCK